MSGEEWHKLEVREIMRRLGTSDGGLTNEEAERRLAEHGFNEIEEKEHASVLSLVIDQLKNPLVVVLVAAALVSLVAGKAVDSIVIGVVIVFNTSIGLFQELRAENALKALKTMASPEADVIRDCLDARQCLELKVKARLLVPGDVVLLDEGDRVPADLRLIEAFSLEVDEAILTGESTPVAKETKAIPGDAQVSDMRNMAFQGTTVTQGRAKAVVVATGVMTEVGKISQLIKETEKAETPLQRSTAVLSKRLGGLALAASSLTIVLGLLRGFEILDLFLFALATAISAIPEGLPAVMTITLAVGVNRMASRNAIIRKLRAVDTLGSATVICTDKTGTLTTNQMTVQRIHVDGRAVEVSGVGFAPEGEFTVGGERIDPQGDPGLKMLLRIIALSNNARLRRREEGGGAKWDVYGDPTEGALVVAAAKAGLQKHMLEDEYPRIDEVPFNAAYRYMATFHQAPGERLMYLKGATESVLDRCSRISLGGREAPLSAEEKERVSALAAEMASQALRVMAVAYGEPGDANIEEYKYLMKTGRADLVYVGLVGMLDPPRPEVERAVSLCKRAGVRVIMATGDHKLTGEAIARAVGLLEEGGSGVTGADLDKMTDEELDGIVYSTTVFARVSPGHKHRIVESLKRQGHVVAMTGDGVNDAPALKASAIGIAMGITGTDVTKETADMVLVDDNFSSIVSAIEEGRVVFENIRKVVKFLVATNTGEILTILGAMILLPQAPLIFTPVQILWVNLVTDGLLDVTLALEPREEDVMDQPPRGREENVINREIIVNIVYVGLFMMVGTLWVFGRGWDGADIVRAQTLGFTALAIFQVFSALNCRSRKRSLFALGVFSNRFLVAAIGASLLLQYMATTVPWMQTMLGTTALSGFDWVLIMLVSSSIFVAEELRKRTGLLRALS